MLRHLSGKARGLRILLYGKDEQRRQTGWIDAQNGEVILARALSVELYPSKEKRARSQFLNLEMAVGRTTNV